MKNFLLLLLVILSSLTATSQEIIGFVLDYHTKQPIDGVNVFVKSKNRGTLSNSAGRFQLQLKLKKRDSIFFSHTSYITQGHTLEALERQQFKIQLKEKSIALSEVSLKGSLNQTKLPFEILGAMPRAVYAFPSLVFKDKIYVFGGNLSHERDESKIALEKISNNPNPSLNDFLKVKRANLNWETYAELIQVFNFKTLNWSLAPYPIQKKAYHNAAVVRDTFYLFSGRQLTTNRRKELLVNYVEIIDSRTGKVLIDYTNPHQASNASSFIFDDNIIILGGSLKTRPDGSKTYTDQVHLFNPQSGLWYVLAPMLQDKETNGILVNNTYYTFGGSRNHPLSEIDAYDLITGKWSRLGHLFNKQNYLALTRFGTTIYGYSKGRFLVYNTKNKTLKAYKIDLDIEQAQLQTDGTYLYLFGGFTEENFTKSPSNSTLRIALNQFAKTKPIALKQIDDLSKVD